MFWILQCRLATIPMLLCKALSETEYVGAGHACRPSGYYWDDRSRNLESHWNSLGVWVPMDFSSTYIRSFNQVQWLDIVPVIAWRHQMETFSALLALCAGNSPVPGEFPSQRPVTRGFYVFFDLRLNKQLNTQSRGWWFETLSRSLWRHCNGYQDMVSPIYSVLD